MGMNHDIKKTGITLLLISLISGAAAGIIGAIATESYLDRYADALSSGSTPPRLGDERSRTSSGSYEESLKRAHERLLPSTVVWHRRLPETASAVRGSYAPEDAIGAGVVVSSDGWVLTSAEVFSVAQVGQMTAVIGGRVYDALEAKADTGTDALLVKIDGVNLTAVSFGDDGKLSSGDRVFAADGNTRLAPGIVLGFSETDLVTTSEALDVFMDLDLPRAVAAGSPVANALGELVGFVREDGSLRPLSFVLPAVLQALRGEEIVRARLGVEVVPLDRAVGHEAYGAGALIVERPAAGTPARLAELEEGDVIMRAGGRDVGGTDTLARILLDTKHGDILTLTVKRGAETFDVDVALDARK